MVAIGNVRTRALGAGRAAFTLTELLVALLVGLLVLAGVHRVFVAGLVTQNTASLQAETNRKAQVGIDAMVSMLRGGSEVRDAQVNRVWFLDQNGYNCRFWVDDGTLRRYLGPAAGSYTGGEPVATDVSQLSFTYLDAAGQPTAQAAAASSVVVAIRVERLGHGTRLESAVRLRNK